MAKDGGAGDSPLQRDDEASASDASGPAGGSEAAGDAEAAAGAWGFSCAPPAGFGAPSPDWAPAEVWWCSGARSLFMMVVTRTAF